MDDSLSEIDTALSTKTSLLQALSSPEDSVRWEAAEALGLLGDPSAIESLLAHITDPDAMVRTCVAEALGCVGKGDRRVTNALCCLLTDPDELVRIFTLQALGDLGDKGALPAVQTRRNAEPPVVRVWVHYALAKLGEEPFAFTETIYLLRTGTMAARIQAATVLTFMVTAEPQKRIVRALERQLARETSEGMRESIGRRLEEARLPIV